MFALSGVEGSNRKYHWLGKGEYKRIPGKLRFSDISKSSIVGLITWGTNSLDWVNNWISTLKVTNLKKHLSK